MKFFTAILLSLTCLWAGDSILSSDKEKIFEYEKQKIKEDSGKLKLDWINPITLSYIREYDKNFDSSKARLSINQPIFKSGGIYSAIKYANHLESKSNLTIEMSRKNLIKEATTLLFNIHKLKSQIKKQSIIIRNLNILYAQIKEQIDAKLLPINRKYDKEIELDRAEIILIDLRSNMRNLISKFKILSNKPYEKVALPKLKLLSKSQYKAKNIELAIERENIKSKENFYKMTVARYLPTVSFYYNYTQIFENSNPMLNEENQYSYGINVSIPLDVRMFYTLESNKVEFLKAKLNLADKANQEKLFFEDVENKLIEIEQKMDFAKKSIAKYSTIILDMEEEEILGMAIDDNIEIYKNYRKQFEEDLTIYDFDKQIELLKIYAKIWK